MNVDFKLDVPIDWKPLERQIIEQSKALMYEQTIKTLNEIPDYEMRNFLKYMREGKPCTTYPRIRGLVCELVYQLVSEYLEMYLKEQTEAIKNEVVEGLIQKIVKRKGFAELKTPEDLELSKAIEENRETS